MESAGCFIIVWVDVSQDGGIHHILYRGMAQSAWGVMSKREHRSLDSYGADVRGGVCNELGRLCKEIVIPLRICLCPMGQA